MGLVKAERPVLIECDYCPATIKPCADIAESGWVKQGVTGSVETTTYACPTCALGLESRR
jgi:hypothetical protein